MIFHHDHQEDRPISESDSYYPSFHSHGSAKKGCTSNSTYTFWKYYAIFHWTVTYARKSRQSHSLCPSLSHSHIKTKWAPTNYKWSYNPYKWPFKWVTGVITLLIGVITLLIGVKNPVITGSGPHLETIQFFLVERRLWNSISDCKSRQPQVFLLIHRKSLSLQKCFVLFWHHHLDKNSEKTHLQPTS